MEKQDLEKIRTELENIENKIDNLSSKLENSKKPFSFSDFIQELTGAVVLAFPFAANADIWEISKKMTPIHALLVLTVTIAGLFVFINYSNLGSWKVQNVGGIVPLRLLTTIAISFVVSTAAILILGIYPGIIDSYGWLLKTVILVTLFSVIGSIGFDAAK